VPSLWLKLNEFALLVGQLHALPYRDNTGQLPRKDEAIALMPLAVTYQPLPRVAVTSALMEFSEPFKMSFKTNLLSYGTAQGDAASSTFQDPPPLRATSPDGSMKGARGDRRKT
jgi:hypothetical protein